MLPGEPQNDIGWQKAETACLMTALGDASATADRLALVRSIVRLNGGRVERADLPLVFSQDLLTSISRFGLAVSDTSVRLVDEQDPRAPKGFWEAQNLDLSLRRYQEHLPPDAVLLRHTQHLDYRSEGQKAAVHSLVTMPKGASLMVCLPTGSGKSLLFQLSGARQREESRGSCVVVITPTVSLAQDHERTLSSISGLEGSRALVGGMDTSARTDLINAFRRGEVPILLMSPEIALGSVREHLIEAAIDPEKKLGALQARLSAIFIDEAHIIESWGRTFRPDFQRLPGLIQELRTQNDDLQCVLLSATLPPSARAVLRASYRSRRGWGEVDAASPRSEFDIVVEGYKDGQSRLDALDFVLDRAPRPLIVYTTLAGDEDEDRKAKDLRLSAAELYARLKGRGYERIALFSGEVASNSERNQIVKDWAENKIDFVVATSAFGMGVDKSNVRSVVHACLPDSPARYYQEIGRAARDGRQGLSVCLFTDAGREAVKDDVSHARTTATSSWITSDVAAPRWDAMLQSSSNSRWFEGKRRLSIDLDSMRQGLTLSNDRNRRWNMSILNLLQRARLLDVISCSQEPSRCIWDVEILEPSLTADDLTEIWARAFSLRDEEQARARREVSQFIAIMRKADTTCVIRDVFDLLQERHADHIPACGRCPGCRVRGETPGLTIPQKSLSDIWPIGSPTTYSRLPPGLTLFVPQDPSFTKELGPLVGRLVGAGIEQVLVPDDIASTCAATLVTAKARLGLVVSHSSIVQHLDGIARLPTAVLLRTSDPRSSVVLQAIKRWQAHGGVPDPLIIVTSPSTELDGRRLDQTLSPRAPYLEDALDHFSILESVA